MKMFVVEHLLVGQLEGHDGPFTIDLNSRSLGFGISMFSDEIYSKWNRF